MPSKHIPPHFTENDKGLYATMKRWCIDPWLYGDIRNLHLRYYIFYDMADGMQAVAMPFAALLGYDTDADRDGNYMFYVVFFTNNLVVKKNCVSLQQNAALGNLKTIFHCVCLHSQ